MLNNENYIQEDLTGMKFGYLTVLEYKPYKNKNNRTIPKWLCRCDCGKLTEVIKHNLINGHTVSCGCARNIRKVKHNMSKTRFHAIWCGMKNRCNNKNVKAYPNYGGRGIKVCEEWYDFKNFMNDMYSSYLEHIDKFGEKETTLDRIDNNKEYSKNNCKWSTNKEQSLNRRSNKKYMINGELLTAFEISKKYNMTYSTVMHRLHRGWSMERIINQKPRKRRVSYAIK